MSSFRRRLIQGTGLAKIATIRINKTVTYDNNNSVTIDDESQIILNELLSKFRRCLCKKTEEGKVAICYLDDNNSDNYYNGTSADTELGSRGCDVMVYFPEFWYLGENTETEYVLNISLKPVLNYKHAKKSLLGAYLASGEMINGVSNCLCSYRYGFGTQNAYGESSAKDRGKGYSITTYLQSNIIQWMFIARYKTTYQRSVFQSFYLVENNLPRNGTTAAIGIKDTSLANASIYTVDEEHYLNFLGLEACWGHVYEQITGIKLTGDNSSNNYSLGIYNENNEIDRTINLPNDTGSYTEIFGGEYMDFIPINCSGDRVFDSYFSMSTKYSQTKVARNGYMSTNYFTSSGLFYLGLTHLNMWCRLSFNGEIEVINDVQTFKNLPIL